MKKSILPGLLMVFMLLFSRHVTEGARYGLLLWYTSVVPSLFPFMVLSDLAVASGGISLLMRPLHRILGRFFPLSENGCYVLASGLLCGCPMGAKTCADFVQSGRISLSEGRFLLAVCNHPSPMFLLGYVCPFFEAEMSAARLLLSMYLPLPLLAAAAKRVYIPAASYAGPRTTASASVPASAPQTSDSSILSAAEILCKIGGCLVFFSIFIVFLRNASWIPVWLRLGLTGTMEMTTGVREAARNLAFPYSGIFSAAVLAFGGLSGVFQTRAVLSSKETDLSGSKDSALTKPLSAADGSRFPQTKKNAGLSIRHYILWKLLHSALSAVLFFLLGAVF